MRLRIDEIAERLELNEWDVQYMLYSQHIPEYYQHGFWRLATTTINFPKGFNHDSDTELPFGTSFTYSFRPDSFYEDGVEPTPQTVVLEIKTRKPIDMRDRVGEDYWEKHSTNPILSDEEFAFLNEEEKKRDEEIHNSIHYNRGDLFFAS